MSNRRSDEVVMALRSQIFSGELRPEEPITEVSIAERLKVSRTPVRIALQALEGEGLVSPRGSRGYAVKKITVYDVLCGFDVRGSLEAFACRTVAERGLKHSEEAALNDCLEKGYELFEQNNKPEATVEKWSEINKTFHDIILKAADNDPLWAAYWAACRHPLVGPGSLVYSSTQIDEDLNLIKQSQAQHHAIVDSLKEGEILRAEAWAREHVYTARKGVESRLKRSSSNSQPQPDSAIFTASKTKPE